MIRAKNSHNCIENKLIENIILTCDKKAIFHIFEGHCKRENS